MFIFIDLFRIFTQLAGNDCFHWIRLTQWIKPDVTTAFAFCLLEWRCTLVHSAHLAFSSFFVVELLRIADIQLLCWKYLLCRCNLFTRINGIFTDLFLIYCCEDESSINDGWTLNTLVSNHFINSVKLWWDLLLDDIDSEVKLLQCSIS